MSLSKNRTKIYLMRGSKLRKLKKKSNFFKVNNIQKKIAWFLLCVLVLYSSLPNNRDQTHRIHRQVFRSSRAY